MKCIRRLALFFIVRSAPITLAQAVVRVHLRTCSQTPGVVARPPHPGYACGLADIIAWEGRRYRWVPPRAGAHSRFILIPGEAAMQTRSENLSARFHALGRSRRIKGKGREASLKIDLFLLAVK